jgi:hypothetical protein
MRCAIWCAIMWSSISVTKKHIEFCLPTAKKWSVAAPTGSTRSTTTATSFPAKMTSFASIGPPLPSCGEQLEPQAGLERKLPERARVRTHNQ